MKFFRTRFFPEDVFKPNAMPLQHDLWWFESDMDSWMNGMIVFLFLVGLIIAKILPSCNQRM